MQNISPGILSEQIDSLQQRINSMLSKENSPQPVVADKIHFASIGRRLKDDNYFKRIATALFSNQQMRIQYRARGQHCEQTERIISAQKLIYYRDNWYIAAYCHVRNNLRIFSVDSVHSVKILEQSAEPVTNEKLQGFLNSAYGIFSGKAKHTAVLEFSKNRANWVADEHWHPDQQGKWLENGSYQLSIPFSDSRELIMDILKHGAEVKVIAPQSLLDAVKEKIEKMQKNYTNNN
ncbi:MAG: helix-turn-helix transcriptional regulator [Methylococcaceae bacterium]